MTALPAIAEVMLAVSECAGDYEEYAKARRQQARSMIEANRYNYDRARLWAHGKRDDLKARADRLGCTVAGLIAILNVAAACRQRAGRKPSPSELARAIELDAIARATARDLSADEFAIAEYEARQSTAGSEAANDAARVLGVAV